MRRIIASEGVTLNGRFSDPEGNIDWQALDEDLKAYSLELLEEVDTLLLGKVTYEQLGAYWPTPLGAEYSRKSAEADGMRGFRESSGIRLAGRR